MKRNKIIIIGLIIFLVIVIAFMSIVRYKNEELHRKARIPLKNQDTNITNDIKEETNNKDSQNNVEAESNNSHNHINIEGTTIEQVENEENSNIMYPDGRLFITFDNKLYLPSTAVQEFNFDFPRTPTNNYLKLIREYFNKLWDTLECDIITIKENDYDATAKFQFSRYSVPKNDLTFYFSSTLDFYEGGTHITDDPLIYTEYFSTYIYVRISNSNIGRSIHASKINNTWYAYKLNVIE